MEDKPQILAIDDEAGISLMLVCLLQEFYRVTAVASAGEARAVLEAGLYPQLILLDLCLPDGSGIEIIDELQAMRPQIPIILLTGTTSKKEVSAALARGAYGYIRKPFSRVELLGMMSKARGISAEAHLNI